MTKTLKLGLDVIFQVGAEFPSLSLTFLSQELRNVVGKINYMLNRTVQEFSSIEESSSLFKKRKALTNFFTLAS